MLVLGWLLAGLGLLGLTVVQVLIAVRNPDVIVGSVPTARRRSALEWLLSLAPLAIGIVGWQIVIRHEPAASPFVAAFVAVAWVPRLVHNWRVRRRSSGSGFRVRRSDRAGEDAERRA